MWRRRTEVLVVVLVVAACVALLLPALQQAREAARRTQSKNNLKQIWLALQNYHDTYTCFPAGGTFDEGGRGHHGWMVSIAPFVDASPLYFSLDFNQPWDSPRNAGFLLVRYSTYTSPGENSSVAHWEFPTAHYSANAHLLAANHWALLKDIDSQGQTFLAAELAGDFVPWACPYNWRPLTTLNGTPPTYGRYTKNGCLFLFVDGHTDFVSNEAFPALRDSLSGPDLAEFGQLPPNIVRPNSFPCPKDALQPDAINLTGEFRWARGLKDFRGRFVRLSTRDPGGKDKPAIAHDADVTLIVAHQELEELEISGDFTDQALSSIKKLTPLRTLELNSDHITEAGLSFVEQLPNLKFLRVTGSQITNEVRQRLRKRLPQTKVMPADE